MNLKQFAISIIILMIVMVVSMVIVVKKSYSDKELRSEIEKIISDGSIKFYCIGYADAENNRPFQTLDIEKEAEGEEYMRLLLAFWYKKYKQGYEDAKDGKPNAIRENLRQQKETVEKIQNTVKLAQTTLDSIKINLEKMK